MIQALASLQQLQGHINSPEKVDNVIGDIREVQLAYILYCDLRALRCAIYAPQEHLEVLIRLEGLETTTVEMRLYAPNDGLSFRPTYT